MNFGDVWRAQLAISTLLTSSMVALDLFRSFKVFSDAKDRMGCGKLPHRFIPSKTATSVPEFAVEDLPLRRTAALVPELLVKDLPSGITLMMITVWYQLGHPKYERLNRSLVFTRTPSLSLGVARGQLWWTMSGFLGFSPTPH